MLTNHKGQMNYDVTMTAVSTRLDLMERTLTSMVKMLDHPPARILINIDVPAGAPHVDVDEPLAEVLERAMGETGIPVEAHYQTPGTGLGRAVHRLLHLADTKFVLYTQDDFDFLRVIPVACCLDVMEKNDLWHVRFNKRKTEWCKGEDRPEHERFYKKEMHYSCSDGTKQTLCASDHWYFQASLWRRDIAAEGFDHLVQHVPNFSSHVEVKYNWWLNGHHGGNPQLRDPYERATKVRTFIWGPVKEPAFIRHTGGDRRSQGWEK